MWTNQTRDAFYGGSWKNTGRADIFSMYNIYIYIYMVFVVVVYCSDTKIQYNAYV